MLLTKEQISEQMRKHAEKKNGLYDLMEIMPVSSSDCTSQLIFLNRITK